MRALLACTLVVLLGLFPTLYAATDRYVVAPTSGTFTDISGTGSRIISAGTDDNYSEPVDLGFGFYFFGGYYSNIRITSNGLASFYGATNEWENSAFSTNALHPDSDAIAAFWDDWIVRDGVYARTTGMPGQRVFTVQWNVRPWSRTGGGGDVVFQMQLHEANSDILLLYPATATSAGFPTNGASASVGIRRVGAPSNGEFLMWSNNSPAIPSGSQVLFSPRTPVIGNVSFNNLAADGALLHADVNPNGRYTWSYFEYGPTTAYGNSAYIWLWPEDGIAPQSVITSIAGLPPLTSCHFRVVASNSLGTSRSRDHSFLTPGSPVFNAATDQPVIVESLTASGLWLTPILNFAPAGNTVLTLVNNTGNEPIAGTLNGLPQGGTLVLSHGNNDYDFIASYTGGTGNDLTLTFTKANQTLAFGPLFDRNFTTTPFPISATASSGFEPSFSIVSGPATLSGNTVTLTGAGTVTIRASQAGNFETNAAADVDLSFNVLPAGQTISFPPLADQTTGAAPFSPGATASSGLPVTFSVVSGPATISGGIVTVGDLGLVTLRASQPGNANYLPATYVERSFRVLSAGPHQTITFPLMGSRTPNAAPFPPGATASSGLPVSYTVVGGNDVASISGGNVLLSGSTGTVTLQASQPGNATFDPAPDVFMSFVVTTTPSGWQSLATGEGHTVAIKSDGTLWTWGLNSSAQLGTGNTLDRNVPWVISNGSWKSAAAGERFSLALTTAGHLFSWGDNSFGQLGYGNNTARTTPGQVGTASDWKAIAAGSFGAHAVALKTDGSLWAWGNNANGQLGDGSTQARTSPVRIGTGNDWKTIVAGSAHTLAIKTNGTLWAWGKNNYGQVGDGSTTDRLSPVQIGSATNWKSLAASQTHTLAIRADGTLWGWGINAFGELGDGSNVMRLTPVQVGTDANWKSVAAGNYYFSLGLRSDGSLWTWGNNYWGTLADGTNSSSGGGSKVPLQVGIDTNWNAVAAGGVTGTRGSFVLSLKTDGSLWAWGDNSAGQFGNGRNGNNESIFNGPQGLRPLSPSLGKLSSLTASPTHVAAVKTDGTLWTWGAGSSGQLGNGSTNPRIQPAQVGTAENWRSVSAGTLGHNVAVKADGSLWTWGANSSAQLGLGDTGTRSVPTRVGTALTWRTATAGAGHCLALKTDGSLWAWGDNSGYQLGNNLADEEPVGIPTKVGTSSDWRSISAGYTHNAAIKTDGTLWMWGQNLNGALGMGGFPLIPTQLGIATDWRSASAGKFFTVAIKTDGSLWAWGLNDRGQLGRGNTSNSSAPVRIGSATDWRAVSASDAHVVAFKTDGTLWTWGDNTFGQLGGGTATSRSSPLQVGTSTAWAGLPNGSKGNSTLLLSLEGTLWAWGANESSQLTIPIYQSVPLQVPPPGTPQTLSITPVIAAVGVPVPLTATTTSGLPVTFSLSGPAVLVDGQLTVTGGGQVNLVAWQSGDSSWAATGPVAASVTVPPVHAAFPSAASVPVTADGFVAGDLTLDFSLGFAPLPGTVLTVVHNTGPGPIEGTFANLPDGALITSDFAGTTFSFLAAYSGGDGNDLTFTAVKTSQVLDFPPLSNKTLGDLPFTISATSNRGLEPVFTIVSGPATISGNLVTLTGEGVVTIRASQPGDAHTAAAPDIERSFIAGRIGQTLTFAPLPGRPYPCPAFELTASSTSGLAPGFMVVSGPAKISGSTVTLTGTGTVTIRAFQLGNASYNLAPSIDQSFTVVPLGTTPQTITFPPLASKLANDPAFTLNGSSNSGLPLTYTVASGGNVATLSGNQITLTGTPGAVTLKATQVGNATYAAASEVYVTFMVQAAGTPRWKAVDPGLQITIGLKTDGTLWSWGRNLYGQLGTGPQSFDFTGTPAQIGSATNWQSHSTGTNHTVAIKSDGTLWAWGYNAYGQLGDGTNTERNTPRQIGTLTNWQSVSAGDNYTLAVRTDGSLWGWGDNGFSKLGDSTSTNRNSPVRIGTASNWKSAHAGQSHSLGVKADGTLWGWGSNGSGQLGDGTTTNRTAPVAIGSVNTWKAASATGNHSIAVRTDGTLWAWGYNSVSQLGDGTTTQRNSPVQIGTATNWKSVDAAGQSSVAVKADGTLWGWGSNTGYNLGDGTNITRTAPLQIGTATSWETVNFGGLHSTAVRSDGSLWVWGGDDYHGQSGYPFRSPAAVSPLLTSVSQNSGDSESSTVLKTDGTLWYLGDGFIAPRQIGTAEWKSTSPFNAVKTNGTLWRWTAANLTPVQFGSETIWKSVHGSIGMKNDGSLWTLGASAPATSFNTETTWVSVAQGYNFHVAKKANGTLWAWGSNSSGQLGDGTATNRATPVQVGTASDWKSVHAGFNHVLAIKNNGTLWAWGSNTWGIINSGQLGDGTFTSRFSPVQIGTATDWISALAANGCSAAVKSDGSLWTWGLNDFGQLGDGTTVPRHTPVRIGTSNGWGEFAGNGAFGVSAKHLLASSADGTLWGIGRGSRGQIAAAGADYTRPSMISPNASPQTVSFPTVLAPPGQPVILAATATSGLPVTYGVSGPATLSGNILTVTGSGAVKLIAYQNGDAHWLPSGPTLARFADNRIFDTAASVPLVANGYDATGQSFSPVFNFAPAAGTVLLALNNTGAGPITGTFDNLPNGGIITAIHGGITYRFLANYAGGDGNDLTLTTLQIEQTLDFAVLPDRVYGDAFNLSATATSGLAPVFDVVSGPATISGNAVTLTGTGPVTLRASQLGNADYAPAPAIGHTFTVAKAEQSLTFDPLPDRTFGEAPFALPATASSGLHAVFTVVRGPATVTGNQLTATGSGKIVVRANQPGNSNYLAAFPLERTFTALSPGAQTIAFGDLGHKFTTDAPFLLGATASSGLPIHYTVIAGGDAVSIDGNLATLTGMPGSVTIKASQPGDETRDAAPDAFITFFVHAASGISPMVSVAGYDTAILTANGSIWAWGSNTFGQIGDGTTVTRTSPVQAAAGGIWKAVGKASTHTIALKTDGTIWAWGNNSLGKLGDGTTISRSSPVQVGSASDWRTIAAAGSLSFAIKTDGTLWAWGANGTGLLGDGTTIHRNTPVQIGVATDWKSVSTSGYMTLAVKTDGTLWAWGFNTYGQLGDGTTTNRNAPVQVGVATHWAEAFAGEYTAGAITTTGTLWRWGMNGGGQFGNGTTAPSSQPVQIGTDTNWKTLSSGLYYVVAVKTDGTLWIWGLASGALYGDGTQASRATPIQIGTESTWVACASSTEHSVAMRSDGTVWSWGSNQYGQRGDVDRLPAVVSPDLGPVVSVSSSNAHTLAVGADGTLWGWGENPLGQLGDGTVLTRRSPVRIGTANHWRSVGTGADHSLGVRHDGTLWAWGGNNYGQLGDGTTLARTAPVQIGSGSDWKAAAAGYRHSVAVKTDGSLWSWGYVLPFNPNGSSSVLAPTRVGTASDWTGVEAHSGTNRAAKADGTYWTWQSSGGTPTTPTLQSPLWTAFATYSHSLGVKANGTLWSYGSNSSGELGRGYTDPNPGSIQQMNAATDWKSVAVGSYFSLALKTNGTLWSWGSNANGQLSGGPYAGRSLPGQIGTFTGWNALPVPCLAGATHSLVTTKDGTLWGVGNNTSGQLAAAGTNPWKPGQIFPIQTVQVLDLPPVAATIGSPLSLAAASSSGLPVRYGVSGPAELEGNQLTVTGSGAVHLIVHQPGDDVWAPTGPAEVVVSVAPARQAQSITFAPLPDQTFGNAPSVLAATSSSGLPVSFNVVSGPATLAANAVSFSGAGVVTVRASQGGDGQFLPAADVLQTFSVNKATASITLGGLSLPYDGDPKPANAVTSPAGLAVVFAYNGSPQAPVAVGSHEVVATIDDANYTGTATGTLIIAPAAQTIDFAALVDRTFGMPSFELSATSSSGLSPAFTVASGPAIISGNTITLTGAGPVVIRASQLGNETYAAAVEVDRSFQVEKAAATVTLAGLARTFDGTPQTVAATTSPPGLTVQFTYDGHPAVPQDAGEYVVVAAIDEANFTGTASGTLVIAKAAQTIDFPPPTGKTYGDAAFPLNVTTSSGLPVTFEVLDGPVTVVNGIATVTAAGTATLRASQGGNTNVHPASAVERVLTISKAPAIIILGETLFTYDGTPKAVLVTTSPAGLAASITYGGSTTPPVGAGSYPIEVTLSETNHTGSTTGTLVIQETLDAYQSSLFTPEEIADPTISGPEADPDDDGIENLLEYAFAMDPKAASTGGLPALDAHEDHLALTFIRRRNTADLIFEMEVSDDMVTWRSGKDESEVLSITPLDANRESVTVRDKEAVSSNPTRYVRIKVTRP